MTSSIVGKYLVNSLARTKSSLVRPLSRFAVETVRFSSVMADEPHVVEIEELHQDACERGENTYKDPETNFTVFTELAHLKRGTCCGNQCRHCPYGFENVKSGIRRVAKLKSGDTATAKNLIQATVSSTFSRDSSRMFSSSANEKRKNVPYTRGGDKGSSQLGTGERRSKDDANFEALGTVDELCSVVGVVHAVISSRRHEFDYRSLEPRLVDVMSRLFDIGSHVAKPRKPEAIDEKVNFIPDGIRGGFDGAHIDALESWVDEMTEDLPELTSFILPTGSVAAAQLHIARTVCRRAERRVVTLVLDEETCDPNALKYLNRLSDFLFVAARWVNFCEGNDEIQYQRESPVERQRQAVSRSLKSDN